MSIRFLVLVAIAAAVPEAVSFAIKANDKVNFANHDLPHSSLGRPSFALGFAELEYLVEFSIGTPPQVILATLDTWSSDTWVFSGREHNAYSPNASSTAEFIDGTFEAIDRDEVQIIGEYYTDVFHWGPSIFWSQFGVVDATGVESLTGTFGIGLSPSENSSMKQKNILFAMKEAGIVSSVAYTLLYDSENKSFSRLLIGKQDNSRYLGALETLPILDDNAYMVRATIYGSSLQVILDHGTVYSFLPGDLISNFAAEVGASYDEQSKSYWVNEVPSLELGCTFGNVTIYVPSNDLWERVENRFRLTFFSNELSSGLNILGDSFLLSAYVIFDAEQRQISIAPIKESISLDLFYNSSD